MNFTRLVIRNLAYYWRTNVPVAAGIAVAVAVTSGALLVGQSVRGTLRRLLFERIGATDYLVSAESAFGEHLADALSGPMQSCPVLYLRGELLDERTSVRIHGVNVYGVDDRFWSLQGASSADGRTLVGAPLARALDLGPGDALLLTVEARQGIPREWLYGRRDQLSKTLRLTPGGILPASRLGEFELHPKQGTVYSVFVPLRLLQRELSMTSQANAVLLADPRHRGDLQPIRDLLRRRFELRDLGLWLREAPGALALESSRILLDDATVRAALDAAEEIGARASPVYSYLAISIRSNGREIPYSVITAGDWGQGLSGVRPSIWLNRWALGELGISAGARVDVDYYLWTEGRALDTRTAHFTLAGAVPAASDSDATLAPEIPGVTEARSMRAWDPPFPLNLRRIRPQDERYWSRYRAAPKAFITLAQGQQLWQTRFGKATSVRFQLPPGVWKEQLSGALCRKLDPEKSGLQIRPIRKAGLDAARGSTDFGEYFLYFSSFLIASAILLSALFFRLMLEQRVREIGILSALGIPPGGLRRVFVSEALALSLAGAIGGILGSFAYGWLLLAGLRSLWIGAVGTDRLALDPSFPALAAGAASGIVLSLAVIVWSLRHFGGISHRSLLAGALESPHDAGRRRRAFAWMSALAALAALWFALLPGFGLSPIAGFFGSGFLLLVSLLSATAVYLRRPARSSLGGSGWPALLRLGARSAMHRPARSLICAALIASAIFIIISTEAFRQDSDEGTGGYPLLAETTLPIVQDLNMDSGREALSVELPASASGLRFVAFRQREGDDASCLNLYAPREPRVLGAPHDFLTSARFGFESAVQPGNPWLLLENLPDSSGAIPAIGDANTIQYSLHLSLGDAVAVNGVRLRLVAALRDSIFQGSLLVSEANFVRAFPEQEGYRFFLLSAPGPPTPQALTSLRQSMAHLAMGIEDSRERLASYHRVENTYLSTFQALGTLGLALGTLGLAALLLRNVLERRQELALLRAVGFRPRALCGIVLAENLALTLWGMAAGTLSAVLPVVPALHARGGSLPLGKSCLVLAAVFLSGLISSAIAAAAVLRAPLLASLRSE